MNNDEGNQITNEKKEKEKQHEQHYLNFIMDENLLFPVNPFPLFLSSGFIAEGRHDQLGGARRFQCGASWNCGGARVLGSVLLYFYINTKKYLAVVLVYNASDSCSYVVTIQVCARKKLGFWQLFLFIFLFFFYR